PSCGSSGRGGSGRPLVAVAREDTSGRSGARAHPPLARRHCCASSLPRVWPVLLVRRSRGRACPGPTTPRPCLAQLREDGRCPWEVVLRDDDATGLLDHAAKRCTPLSIRQLREQLSDRWVALSEWSVASLLSDLAAHTAF